MASTTHRFLPSEPQPEEVPIQAALPLRVERPADAPLIPARILNEFVYCPRLAYLEWVRKEWEDSSDTVEGRHVHRRVDAKGGALPEPDADFEAMKPARFIQKVLRSLPQASWVWVWRGHAELMCGAIAPRAIQQSSQYGCRVGYRREWRRRGRA